MAGTLGIHIELSRASAWARNDTADIPTLEVNMETTTETEVALAVSNLKNGKAADTDYIQPDLLKHAETVIPDFDEAI